MIFGEGSKLHVVLLQIHVMSDRVRIISSHMYLENLLSLGKDRNEAAAAAPLPTPVPGPPPPTTALGVRNSAEADAAVASCWSNRSRRSLRACSMNERNRSTKSTRVRCVDWTTVSGSATGRRSGVVAPPTAWRARRLKLNVRLRAAAVARLVAAACCWSTTVDD